MALGGGGGIRQAIGIDGKDQVVAGFNEIGAAGEKSFNKIDRSAQGASQSLRGFTREASGARRIVSQFGGDIGRSLENIGALLGGIRGGFVGAFAGAAVVKGISSVTDLLDKQIERLTKIRDLAFETAQKPAAVAAAQNIARSIGEDAKVADTVLKTQAELFAKIQAERLKQGNIFTGGQSDADRKLAEQRSMLMGGPQVLRGGKDPTSTAIDLAKATDLLIDRTKRYADTKEGMLQFQNDLDVAFLKVAKSGRLGVTQLNEFSKAVTGLPSQTAIPFLTAKVAEFTKAMADAGKIEPLLAAIKQLETEQGGLAVAFNKATEGMVLTYTQFLTRVTAATRQAFEIAATDWGSAIFFALQKAGEAQGSIIPNFVSFLFGPNWIDETRAAFSGLLDWMKSAAQAAASAIGALLLPGGDPARAPQLPQFAGGGMIRGAGSGTSDSILARLSNGEFVMRSAAVRHWGAGLLASMNAAAGGLSMPLLPNRSGRFADGGLVAAGGGTGRAVHLHLGGQSFALSGAGNVVDALVSHARQQQMRSSGVKPSWYGGRANG